MLALPRKRKAPDLSPPPVERVYALELVVREAALVRPGVKK